MWHLTQIPKTVHFYWGRSKLSYLRFLSVESFQRHNPDWTIEVHVPAIPSNTAPAWDTFQQKNANIEHDYFDELSGIDGVTIVEHDFSDYDFDNNAHEVHKSDFLRWRLLASQGGVWSDIDILYVQPMTQLIDNTEANAHIDTVLCPLIPPNKHTVGFLMSGPDNQFCSWMHQTSRACYDPAVYQCMGSDILNRNFATLESFRERFDNEFLFLDRYSVYAVTSKQIESFFQPVDSGIKKRIARPGVIGLHWFAGHPSSQDFEAGFAPDTADQYDNLLTHVLKEPHEA